jgi:hypothetical protein
LPIYFFVNWNSIDLDEWAILFLKIPF